MRKKDSRTKPGTPSRIWGWLWPEPRPEPPAMQEVAPLSEISGTQPAAGPPAEQFGSLTKPAAMPADPEPQVIPFTVPTVPAVSAAENLVAAAAPAPVAPEDLTLPTPSSEEKQEGVSDIMNLFVEEQVINSDLDRLTRSLPEVDLTDLLSDCRSLAALLRARRN
ncbi:MAG: hypothetical protein HYX90_08455 [Chloroflexi bacterium]|nr:hypothetical protein [Chloroflexota bacterium]